MSQAAPASAKRPSVLVVDDDRDIRDVVELVLRHEGVEVETAENGKTALDRLRSGPPPSMILLDLMMPVMDGWSFHEAVARDAELRQIPIVIMTAFDDTTRPIPKTKALLRKPITFETLRDSLRAHLRG